jgi:hypothetical protein
MRFSAFTAGATALAACSGGSSPTTAPPPQTGSLTVTVTAPVSGTPGVTVTGPSGFDATIHATQTLTGLVPGTYTVAAMPVVTTVTYAQRPGSGGLWVRDAANRIVLQYTATPGPAAVAVVVESTYLQSPSGVADQGDSTVKSFAPDQLEVNDSATGSHGSPIALAFDPHAE